jgi:hypothetical protein
MCCPGAIFFGAGISLRLGKELFLPKVQLKKWLGTLEV